MPWRTAVVAILCVAGLAARIATLSAHHSHANYDVTTWTVMEGTVKQLVLMAPHSIVYLEVKDEKSGKVTDWEIELMSLNHLRSYGWTSKTVKVGDLVFATGSPAKSGAPSMIASRVKLPDGREIRS